MNEEARRKFYTDNMLTGVFSEKFINSLNPGQLAMISSCMYFESKLQEGIRKGQKWVYTNDQRYALQSSSFDRVAESDGKYGVNCAMPSGWAMIDMGVLNEGQRYWGDSNCKIANYEKVGRQIEECCIVREWAGGVPFCDLYSGGFARAGDTLMAKLHTFVYLGEDKVLAAGHDGKWHTDPEARTEDSRKAVFETWFCDMPTNSDFKCRVYWQFSFKDEFIPRYYRNSRRERVLNPMIGE